jgi:aryl-alcohol dehydrogenase-like predicted oxidoreductase
MIKKISFGKTGHQSSRTIFGSVSLGRVSQSEADRALDLLWEYGVNHIDTAPRYGEAELRLGPWMKKYRERFFLGTNVSGCQGTVSALSGSAAGGQRGSAAVS